MHNKKSFVTLILACRLPVSIRVSPHRVQRRSNLVVLREPSTTDSANADARAIRREGEHPQAAHRSGEKVHRAVRCTC
eukprot:scaffold96075_cov31-Tisochrysis_lutea.AAC.4